MYKPNFLVDLHGHTTRSDGLDTPKQFVDRAVELGMKVSAITDHDILPPETVKVGEEEIDIVEYAKSKGLELVLGSEISCDTEIEDVHLLCFNCDWKHPKMRELTDRIARSKVESYRKLVQILKIEGMDISWEELIANNGSPIEENEIQKKLIFNMLAEKGYFATWKDAKVMTQKNKNLNVKREKPDPIEIIKLVHELGGIVILAHPYLVHPDSEMLYKYLQPLMEAGLDGIEAQYTYSKTNYKGDKDDAYLVQDIKDKYGNMGIFISGGSDYHGEWRKGVENPREMGESGISMEEFNSSILHKISGEKW